MSKFIDDLDISGLGFKAEPTATGRPGYHHPKTMLTLYVYGYLNRVQSSRRLEVEAQRNIELMWLTGRLAPDQQLSLTDPDARSMNSRGTGVVGYNVASPDRSPRGEQGRQRPPTAGQDGEAGQRGTGHEAADRGGRPGLLQR